MITTDTKKNLCEICNLKNEFPQCLPNSVEFGDGLGNDNIISCNNYNGKCKLLVHNSTTKENEWIDGEVIRKQNSYSGEDFPYRYDVKVENGIYEACHPDCMKTI